MNLLIYVPQMAPYGGMERHVCTLAAALAARGHRVVLLTTSNSLGPDLRAELSGAGVSMRELAAGRGCASRAHKTAWMARESLRARLSHWDVIYTNGQSALARFAWFAARSGTRIVHHHHTSADPREQRSWSPAFRRVLLHAPELVACSRVTQQSLAGTLGRDDVRFLPYVTARPLDASLVTDGDYTADSPLHFGFLGRLVAEKGIDAICALSRRPELAGITWHIHGAGTAYPPDFFKSYPRIVYHGAFVGSSRQAEVLQTLDALVLFSIHNEGMPLSLIEGMSAGLPWIATDRGGTRELALSPANSLLVDHADDLDLLSTAVQALAHRLRAGLTSRREQRRAYDQAFTPAVVIAAWCAYLENAHRDPVVTTPAHEHA